MSSTSGARPGGVLGAALALVLVFAAVRLTASPPPRVAEPPADPSPVTAELTELPPRGSLAGDDRWLRGVLALDALAGLPAERRVALATELPEERVALVLGRGDGEDVAAWLTGPPGAPPDRMALAAEPYPVVDDQPLALWDVPRPGSVLGLLVVVTLPGDEVAFAPGTWVDARDSAEPVPDRLPVTDGFAAAPVALPASDRGGRVTVTRDDGVGRGVTPRLSRRALDLAEAPIQPADPRGLRGTVDEGRLQELLHEMTGAYGMPAGEMAPVLLAAGPVGDDGAPAILVGGTLPTGATVAWLGVARPGADGPHLRTVSTVPGEAGTALADRVLAVPAGWAVSRLPLPPAAVPPGWLVVSGPRGGVSADALNGRGSVLGTFPLVGGAGVAEVPQGTAAIRVHDAAGASLGGTRVTALVG